MCITECTKTLLSLLGIATLRIASYKKLDTWRDWRHAQDDTLSSLAQFVKRQGVVLRPERVKGINLLTKVLNVCRKLGCNKNKSLIRPACTSAYVEPIY